MVHLKDVEDDKRMMVVQFLLQNSKDGKPKYGKMKEAGIKFNLGRRTVTRFWAEAKKQNNRGQLINLTTKARYTPCFTKRIQIDKEQIQSLELCRRGTIRKLAFGIKCSKSTVGRWVNLGLIRAHTSAIKPDLTVSNKLLRLRFSLEALEYDRIANILRFKTMHNTVHIDGKWFYMTKASHRFYLTQDEPEPHRSCKSKTHIKKVMFMSAVCRPIIDENGVVIFDGKIGIFPFIEEVPAKRNSKNRSAGTLETKPLQSITRVVTKECFINQIVSAIMVKWPEGASKLIFIQQDNAKPHISDSDPEFRHAASQNGFDIRIVHQPPNSPDTNVNDLGWFRAIQSIQEENVCTTVDQLVNAVCNSFIELSPVALNKVFLSLQGCMIETMRMNGHNAYKVPHMSKDALIRQNVLPITLEVDKELVNECISHMIEAGEEERMQHLIQELGYGYEADT
ncbi:uncharacterized protein LOC131025782 [Salvia miltiorrhiza]|uniref:uncharacterized protein LOC131025782 n=1 Tax=Salvia miltiorrhiza TaxID=226208 RepID=UPI0025AC3323|nr:uncharacterized protein LOC131025782 [Salvia miltiorrhiza]